MIANYHTHTWRCNHASGSEREYVDNALKAGLRTLGFSDHSPYVFPAGYYSHFRMKMDQLEDYVRCVLDLRREYAGRMEIPLGLELEFYPKFFPELMSILRDYPLDYLLLGQHFVGNEIDSHYSGHTTRGDAVLEQYCDQSIEAMQTGLVTYFAHPDLMYYAGDSGFYRQQMRRICVEAKACRIPLELNLLGLRSGRNYPDRRFWELAAEEGNPVILGRDAHAAADLLDVKTEARARQMISELGLHLIDTVDFRKI